MLFPLRLSLFLWRFYPILGHGLQLLSFAIILIGHTTLDKTPSDQSDAQTTHNTGKTETSSSPARIELTIPANERPQTDALDRATTGIDPIIFYLLTYLLT